MNTGNQDRAAMAADIERARAVKEIYETELLGKPNVVGVGVGLRQTGGVVQNQVSLVVMVRHKLPTIQLAPEEVIPAELDGVPVDVQEVGDIGAQS